MIYPLTVQAERLAGKPAVIDHWPDGTLLIWSYAELNRQANRLAHVFRDLGLNPGDRFIWCGPNSPAVVAVGHARAKIGATAVPLNYRLTPEETAYIVADSDAVLIYADAEQAETFARIRDQMPRVRHVVIYGGRVPEGMLDGDALVAQASPAELPPAPADHPALMLYTSGTTGRPKGAAVSRSIPPRSRHCSSTSDSGKTTSISRPGRSITRGREGSCRSRISSGTPR
jgi:acyl-coenzyme A synthetase/AMP-(fatty) acid ligase